MEGEDGSDVVADFLVYNSGVVLLTFWQVPRPFLKASEALEIMADSRHDTVMVSDDNVVRPAGMWGLIRQDPFP